MDRARECVWQREKTKEGDRNREGASERGREGGRGRKGGTDRGFRVKVLGFGVWGLWFRV